MHLVGTEAVVTSVSFREFVVANRSCEISKIWIDMEESRRILWTCHDSQRSRALRSLALSRSTFAPRGG